MQINNREDLFDYILKRLGFPVTNQELTDDHIDMAIDDAIQLFYERSSLDTMIKGVMVVDIIDGEAPIVLPSFVVNVVRLIRNNPDVKLEEILRYTPNDMQQYSILSIYTYKSYMATLKNHFFRPVNFQFDKSDKSLIITPTPISGESFAVMYYGKIDSESGFIMGHRWIKDYATALAKRQWGMNLTKYDGFVVAGGITINGSELKSEAIEEITTLKQELEEQYMGHATFRKG